MTSSKQYDLEDRTYIFARECRSFIKKLPKTTSNLVDGQQLARSSGSIAANYIEANESLSKKDFIHRVKISKKETKESRLWLKLVYVGNSTTTEKERERLIRETNELMKIFGSIIEKSK